VFSDSTSTCKASLLQVDSSEIIWDFVLRTGYAPLVLESYLVLPDTTLQFLERMFYSTYRYVLRLDRLSFARLQVSSEFIGFKLLVKAELRSVEGGLQAPRVSLNIAKSEPFTYGH
jgi:hypothetical protein